MKEIELFTKPLLFATFPKYLLPGYFQAHGFWKQSTQHKAPCFNSIKISKANDIGFIFSLMIMDKSNTLFGIWYKAPIIKMHIGMPHYTNLWNSNERTKKKIILGFFLYVLSHYFAGFIYGKVFSRNMVKRCLVGYMHVKKSMQLEIYKLKNVFLFYL